MGILIFYLGAIMGSFYNVIGTRLPKKEKVLITRSHCDNCGKDLKWYNLIPIFSYLFQNGKCSFCKEKISSDHFWVEIGTGFLFLLTLIYFPIGYEFFIGLIVSSLLIIIFVSDFKYMIILDSPLIISTILIVILKIIYYSSQNVLYSLISGIALTLVMILVYILGNFDFKKESLGGGDIKFTFIIGLILGFKVGLAALILSVFLALPYAIATLELKKNSEFPYGPFLAGALLIVFFHYDKFVLLIDFLFNF